jgi:Cu(I)/Ag(I) efflux system membrane fusion protein
LRGAAPELSNGGLWDRVLWKLNFRKQSRQPKFRKMSNGKRIFRAAWLGILLLALGTGSCSRTGHEEPATADIDHWTCSMHPSVRSQTPGKCPICGMDLVPVSKNVKVPGSPVRFEPSQFIVPIERQQQIGVTYTAARRRAMRLELRSVGTLEPDQARVFEYVARADGYVRELKVTSPGDRVSAGQALLTIYIPALRAAELEFVTLVRARAAGTGTQTTSPQTTSLDQLFDEALRRLQSWNVGQREIDELERTQQTTEELILRSPFDGVVEQLGAKVGQNVQAGDKLLRVLDLSKLWLWADFYENEIGLLKEGQRIQVTLSAFPNRPLEGSISVISPTIDMVKRTVRVRIDLQNSAGWLRPGMYANVAAEIDCGEGLTIPVDAVLPTGSQMLVFLDRGEGRLEARFIRLGRQFADPGSQPQERYYEVLGGLHEGDRIVSSANFLIDAESQIQGALKGWERSPETGEAPAPADEMKREHPVAPKQT